MEDREAVSAIAAGDPTGIAVAYDRYAAPLYGYCRWMLRQPADAIEALCDTFVIAAATFGHLPEAPKLRPWLYAVARKECQRQLRIAPKAHAGEADEVDRRTNMGKYVEAAGQSISAAEVMQPFRAIREPTDAAGQPIDATLHFRAIREPTDANNEPTEVMEPIRAIRARASVVDCTTGVDGNPKQADLAAMVCAVLGELTSLSGVMRPLG